MTLPRALEMFYQPTRLREDPTTTQLSNTHAQHANNDTRREPDPPSTPPGAAPSKTSLQHRCPPDPSSARPDPARGAGRRSPDPFGPRWGDPMEPAPRAHATKAPTTKPPPPNSACLVPRLLPTQPPQASLKAGTTGCIVGASLHGRLQRVPRRRENNGDKFPTQEGAQRAPRAFSASSRAPRKCRQSSSSARVAGEFRSVSRVPHKL